MPDGAYRLGFRADAAAIGGMTASGLTFPGKVAVTEISGSESFVRVDVGLGVWVCLAERLQVWQPGSDVEVGVDAAGAYVFDAAGALAATPGMAKSA